MIKSLYNLKLLIDSLDESSDELLSLKDDLSYILNKHTALLHESRIVQADSTEEENRYIIKSVNGIKIIQPEDLTYEKQEVTDSKRDGVLALHMDFKKSLRSITFKWKEMSKSDWIIFENATNIEKNHFINIEYLDFDSNNIVTKEFYRQDTVKIGGIKVTSSGTVYKDVEISFIET